MGRGRARSLRPGRGPRRLRALRRGAPRASAWAAEHGIRIGINPIGWTNDDLEELGDDIPLETCLAEARAAGYDGRGAGPQVPSPGRRAAPILARHGLALVSGWYGAELRRRPAKAELAAAEPHLALLAELGCPVMVFAEVSDSVQGRRDVPLSRRPRLAEAEWPRFGEALTEVAESLRGRGVRLAYHHHMGTVIETEGEIDRLMAVTGEAVGLLLDTGHLTYAGETPPASPAVTPARIVHVHCKDVRPAVLDERAGAIGASSTPSWPACSRCPATARGLPGGCYARWPAPGTPAGSWWRPSRTRRWPIRSPTRGWATPT